MTQIKFAKMPHSTLDFPNENYASMLEGKSWGCQSDELQRVLEDGSRWLAIYILR